MLYANPTNTSLDNQAFDVSYIDLTYADKDKLFATSALLTL